MDGQQDGDWGSKVPHTITKDQVHDHLNNLNMFMGTHGMHPKVLRELVDGIAKTLSMILEKSRQSGEDPGDWKKGKVAIFKKGRKEDIGNY